MNWQPLLTELALWPQGSAKFWLRDDDAISDTSALQTLLAVTDPLPIAIAAIPATCDASLPALLANYSRAAVLQHGWAHLKHDGQTSEFPVSRNSTEVFAELQDGHAKLTELFGSQFLPVMAPPFHGWSNDFTALLEVAGFTGFSIKETALLPRRTLKVVNVHVAPIVWQGPGIPPILGNPDTHIAAIVTQLQQRRSSGSTEPIGILTHHLAHDAAITAFVEELAGILDANPAVEVAHPTTLFLGGNDGFTKLLLHCDGADAATTFIDSSPSAHAVTAGGNAQVDTAQSKFGGASGLFDGATDYLTIPDHVDLELGAGDFTIDNWVRFNSIAAGTNTFIQKGRIASADISWSWSYSTVAGLTFGSSTSGTGNTTAISRAWSPSLATWYHAAVIRTGTIVRLFVDGVQLGADGIDSETFLNAAGAVSVGGNTIGGNALNGWLDEVRISKGIARWVGNFTPPVLPYS